MTDNKAMLDQFIRSIDYNVLAEQKEFLLNHGGHEAMGVAHMIDRIQEIAYDILGDDINLFVKNSIN